MACVTDDEFAALLEGRLDADAAARVHAHLEGCSACMGVCAALGQSLVPTENAPRAGQRFGHYVLSRELGHGGMGVVFEAEDVRLHRRVAVKFVARHLVHEEQALARFRREARAASQLDHANLCAVLDVGEELTSPYLVLAFVEGESLKQRLARGRAPFAEALPLLRQIAAGLAAAHRAGITHRDIKPGNVMVTADGQIKVLDFGLAKLDALDSQSLTRTGDVVGTAAYMAPEQHRGAEVGARADVWAVGVLAYELLCGRLPFAGPTLAALANAVLHDEPRPITASDGVPDDMRAVLGKCLEKDPALRYADAVALSADLERLAQGLSVSARGTSRLRSALRRGRRQIAQGLLAAVLVSAGVSGAWGWHQRRQIAQRTELAGRMGRAVQEMRNRMRAAYLLPLHDITPERKAVEAQLRAIARDGAGLDGEARGAVEYALAEGQLALRRYAEARPHFEAAERAGEHSADFHLSYGVTLTRLYADALATAASLPTDTARHQAQSEAQQKLRDPAIAQLRAAAGSADMPEEFVLGLIASNEHRYGDAAKQAHHAFAKAPLFYEAGMLEAQSLARSASELFAKDATAGQAMAQQSIDRATAAIDVARSDPAAYQTRARALLLFANQVINVGTDGEPLFVRAIADLDTALRIYPDDLLVVVTSATARNQLADERRATGKPLGDVVKESIALGHRAASLDPNEADAYQQTANAYAILVDDARERGEDTAALFEQSMAQYRLALARMPSDLGYGNAASLLASQATAEIDNGRDATALFREAVELSEKAIALQGAFEPDLTYYRLGSISVQWGAWQQEQGQDPTTNLDRGHENLLRAASLNRNSSSVHSYLGYEGRLRVLEALRSGRDAKRWVALSIDPLRECLRIDPKEASCATDLTRDLALSGLVEVVAGRDPTIELAQARRQAVDVGQAQPKNSDSYLNAAWVELTAALWEHRHGKRPTQSLEAARRALDRGVEVDQHDAHLQLLSAEVRRRQVEWAGASPAVLPVALGLLEKALLRRPNMAEARLLRAAIWRLQKDPRADAERAAALQLNPLLAGDFLSY